jgi:hypothetical protein
MSRTENLDRPSALPRPFEFNHVAILKWLLALVLLTAPATVRAAADDAVVIYPAAQGRAEAANGFIRLGYHRQTVLFVLGEPSHKLNDNLWVYRGFRSNAPSARGFDTLVLQFENDRFIAFKFLNEHMLKAAVALFNHTQTGVRNDVRVAGARQ